ncbi:arylacetamide deacetylase-like [Montipora capricornis]|uniref:arylacetamide deacetylase-like n=1 Tax=Montipora foliosa TaxID=591990 RepID=UPI0035F12B3F
MANCCLICTSLLAFPVAFLVGLYYNQLIPKGLPDDHHASVRLYGTSQDIGYFLGSLASLVGIGDHPINMNAFLRLLKPFSQIEMDKSWEMEDTTISNVPVLIYRPKYLDKGEKRTGVVYIHGGGWVFGAPDLFHPFTYPLAKGSDAVLISVDYRLAPKHPFPVQFHECYAVVDTVLDNAYLYGIDRNRIVIAGDSSGGNLAAAVALKLRDENKKIAAQVLIQPTLQFMDFSLPSIKSMDSGAITANLLAHFWSHYITGSSSMAPSFLVNNHSSHLLNTKYSSYIGVNDKEKHKTEKITGKPSYLIPKAVLDALTDYRASPLMADNLKGLPKTMLITCEYDILRDDGLLYKARLKDAGVEVRHINYMAFHAFYVVQTLSFLTTQEFHLAVQDITDFIKEL